MSRTLKDVTRQIKEQADIVAVIGRTVSLKKAGASYKGKCPFHNEKTPSFNVVPAKGIYHCFGCGAGGSVIDFVMKADRLEFIDAVKKLAAELGIEVPEYRGGPDKAARDAEEDRLRSVQSANDFALKWFRANLLERRNTVAVAYVAKRGISPEMGEKFQLGAALEGWSHLTDAAMRAGFSAELLIEAGLSKRSEGKGSVYDSFRNRLIFPIFDHLNRCIGFGGRCLDDDPAKYINSMETALYKKGRSLYALNLAQKAISDSGFALLTEGYLDTLMAHQHGFPQAVASLGTSLTPDQARLLKRFASRVYFLYDGDSAGQNAMLKGGGPLLEAGFDTRVISLPPEDDPDTFLRREGRDALSALIASAGEYFDFALEARAAGLDTHSLAGQAELVERTAPLINAFRNEIQRAGAINRLLSMLGGLPRDALIRMLDKSRAETSRRAERSAWSGEAEPAGPPRDQRPYDSLDKFVLRLMIESFEALEILRAGLSDSWLLDERIEPWVSYFHAGREDAHGMIAAAEAEGQMPADPAILPAILAENQPLGDAAHTAHMTLARLKRRHHKRITAQLLDELKSHRHEDLGVPENLLRTIQEEQSLAVRTILPKFPHVIE
ncbi:DNA primase [Candidatus Poribacteria bacterium]|nr:DNA primase [Candidatus Poribacteria bacterium]